ncbi:MAG: PcfJ domain-containing protein [Chitinophagaceae bacterium]|nr:PcfJ domain-containing protein [Chitinophagaceae bacterium]
MKKISKMERKRLALLSAQKFEAAERVLRFSKMRFKRFSDIIIALYEGADLSDYFSDVRISRVFQSYQMAENSGCPSKEMLRDSFLYLNGNSRLMKGDEQILAVFNMVSFHHDWIRNVNEWKPVSKVTQEQVKELAEFLFCRYPMPEFLYKAFLNNQHSMFMEWFIRLGRGESMRDFQNLPLILTRRAAHFFLKAPAKFSIPEALRWSQARGHGSTVQLAERIAYSWLSVKPKGKEDFWDSFISLLARDKEFDHNHTGELIDYVREQKRLNTGYSLKGRTVQSLFRQSDHWHRHLSVDKIDRFWDPSGIEGLQIRKKQELVLLEELHSQRELMEEGRTMKHCVASYSFYCAAGRSTIFSMRKYVDGLLVEKLATIEINLSQRKIVQAKAKMNKPISDEAKNYLTIWAGKEELLMGPYL